MISHTDLLSNYNMDNIQQGHIIYIERLEGDAVSKLLERSKQLGCKLICMDHIGKTYWFKDIRSKLREKSINELLSDI